MKNKQFDMVRETKYKDGKLDSDYVRIYHNRSFMNVDVKDIPQFIKELSDKLD